MPHKPKPFKRPSINISTNKRVWTDAPVENLFYDDNVLGKGLIKGITRRDGDIIVTYASGNVDRFKRGDVVHAFTAA